MPGDLARLAISVGGVRGGIDFRRLEPMRPVPGRPRLVAEGWLFELKLDGYRLLADVRGREVALRYRSGHDCTQAFPEIVTALAKMRVRRLVLDGEVVAFDEDGRPDFDRLAPRLCRTHGPRPPVSYHVFDVLAVGDVDVRSVALARRKELVATVVEHSKGALRAVPFVAGDGRELAAFVVKHDLEGLVAKRADSPYIAGASSHWVKGKRRHEEEFVVTGYRVDREGRIDALALAKARGKTLLRQGVVEMGSWRVRDAFPGLAKTRGWSGAMTRVVVTVTFTGRTSAGRLREAAVKGVRADV
jgi:bifunctional non-homologous end joining protein LigD